MLRSIHGKKFLPQRQPSSVASKTYFFTVCRKLPYILVDFFMKELLQRLTADPIPIQPCRILLSIKQIMQRDSFFCTSTEIFHSSVFNQNRSILCILSVPAQPLPVYLKEQNILFIKHTNLISLINGIEEHAFSIHIPCQITFQKRFDFPVIHIGNQQNILQHIFYFSEDFHLLQSLHFLRLL